MLGVRLFPPQILSDLNFFNVSSPKVLSLRLRTVQRVAVAAIATYLYLRYVPQLKFPIRSMASLAFLGGNGFLSAPVSILTMSQVLSYEGMMMGICSYRDKKIGWLVASVGVVFYSYVLSQVYRHPETERSPNLLEKLFQKVEDSCIQPLWDRFYKKKSY